MGKNQKAISVSRNLPTFSKIELARKEAKLINTDIDEVKFHIKRMFVLLGLNQANYPKTVEFDYISLAYKEIYGGYSIKEIELAVNLSLSGDIKYTINLYDKPFSPVLFSPLMIKYKEYRRINRRSKSVIEKQRTREEDYREMKETAIKYFNNYRNGDSSGLTFYLYDWLNRYEILIPEDDSKCEALKTASMELEKEMEKEKSMCINSGEVKKVLDSYNKTKQINRAKEINLKEYFDDLIEKGMEIEDVIDKKLD